MCGQAASTTCCIMRSAWWCNARTIALTLCTNAMKQINADDADILCQAKQSHLEYQIFMPNRPNPLFQLRDRPHIIQKLKARAQNLECGTHIPTIQSAKLDCISPNYVVYVHVQGNQISHWLRPSEKAVGARTVVHNPARLTHF